MPVTDLDAQLWEQVTYRLNHPDVIADGVRQAWHETNTLTEADLTTLNTQAAEIGRKQAR